MSIRCPHCKKEYDVTLFEFGREIVCECGTKIGLKHEETFGKLEDDFRKYELELEEEKLTKIKRAHDKIALLIMNTDYQGVDIEIEKAKFKELIEELFPDKAHLYELIYEPRFRRLWEQFRSKGGRND
jgi:DNA-directed RNA polymerase subunit RPC12/RpoP